MTDYSSCFITTCSPRTTHLQHLSGSHLDGFQYLQMLEVGGWRRPDIHCRYSTTERAQVITSL